ncbi:MAG: hypothetical protein R3E95_10320 [Thiolinea sp.]
MEDDTCRRIEIDAICPRVEVCMPTPDTTPGAVNVIISVNGQQVNRQRVQGSFESSFIPKVSGKQEVEITFDGYGSAPSKYVRKTAIVKAPPSTDAR